MQNDNFIFDHLDEICSKIDFELIHHMLDTIKLEIPVSSRWKDHNLEDFTEEMYDDEIFDECIPNINVIKYLIQWAIVDSYMSETNTNVFYIDFMYEGEHLFPVIDMSDLESLYKEHEMLREEYEQDKKLLAEKEYKGICSKEFCNKLVSLYWEREFDKIQDVDFPPTTYNMPTVESYVKEYENLCKQSGKLTSKGTSDIIRGFHGSIIFANAEKSLSPFEGWQLIKNNPDVFIRFYANRLRYSDFFRDNIDYFLEGNLPLWCYGLGLSTSRQFPQVSYFKPKLAKYIVENYLSDYATVFDPFSGYSGRMLGTLACGKNYIGQDLCSLSVAESNNIYKFLKDCFGNVPKAEINVANTEETTGEYECLFTCSPYNNKENWDGVPSVDYNCDKWIDICIKNFKCKKYVFVTDETIEKYKPFVKETITNSSDFGKNDEYIVVITEEDVK